MTPGAAAVELKNFETETMNDIKQKMQSGAARLANELRNSEIKVLTNASPSAPGSPPGVRTGNLRSNWANSASGGGFSYVVRGESGAFYAGFLENGTRKMAARPFLDKIAEDVEPKIDSLFSF